MKYYNCIYVVFVSFFLSFPFYLFADVSIEIEYPDIDILDIGIIEDDINQYFEDYFDFIENDIHKEKMVQAFSEANAFTNSVILYPVVYNFTIVSFSFNLSVASQLFSSDFNEISETLGNATIEEDLYLGFGFQPFTCSLLLYPVFFFPALPDYLSGLIFGINLGGASILYHIYPFLSFNIGISVTYPIFSAQQLNKLLTWDPLKIHTGLSFFYNKISYQYDYDIELPITVDPDGPGGPLNEIPGNIVVPFSPEVSLCSETFVLPISVATSFTIGWFFMIDMGFGLDLFIGRSYFSIADDSEISISGEAAAYTESKGQLLVSGFFHVNYPDLLRFKISTAFGFILDPVWIKIPIIYYFNNGISAGIKVGFSY